MYMYVYYCVVILVIDKHVHVQHIVTAGIVHVHVHVLELKQYAYL